MPTVSKGIYTWLFRGAPVLEDFADRLSHVWTVGLLLLFACIISWKQQSFNDPISCWVPAEFSDAHVSYTHITCWNNNRLNLANVDYDIPRVIQRIPTVWVYKWLPLVLCIQALLFKLPSILMHVLHGYSGINFENVAGLTFGYDNLSLTERTFLGKQTGCYLYNWCKQWGGCLPWRMLSILWLFIKLLFCANALVQFVLVDKLLSTKTRPFDKGTSYGDVIFNNLFNSSALEWKQSPIFPRRVMCTYKIRMTRNVYAYSVQCDLPINEFNEYVYMFIWIWLLLVVTISFISLAVWLVRTLIPIPRQRYISKMLELSDDPNVSHASGSGKLASLVGEDGVMVLKLISSNSSEHLVRDVVSTMHQLAQRQSPYSYAPVTPHPATQPGIQPSAPVTMVPQGAGQTVSYPSLELQQTASATQHKEHLP